LAFNLGREADHSPLSSAKVKEWVELYLHSSNTPSWRGAQLGRAQGQPVSIICLLKLLVTTWLDAYNIALTCPVYIPRDVYSILEKFHPYKY
jgi:hypothetical protein